MKFCDLVSFTLIHVWYLMVYYEALLGGVPCCPSEF